MHLYNISLIKAFLDRPSRERIIHAFVTSKLDYGNALLYGYPASLLQRLQRVQNSAARILSGQSKYDHITPTLRKLHWLPSSSSRQNINWLQDTCRTSSVPMCHLETSDQPARSWNSRIVRNSKSEMVTQRAFCVAGPRLWNSLPLELRLANKLESFKRGLKTYLFVQHFG